MSEAQVSEVVRELSNMICGAVLTSVHGNSLFELTGPELQDPAQALAAAAASVSRTFDLSDGLLQAYIRVN